MPVLQSFRNIPENIQELFRETRNFNQDVNDFLQSPNLMDTIATTEEGVSFAYEVPWTFLQWQLDTDLGTGDDNCAVSIFQNPTGSNTHILLRHTRAADTWSFYYGGTSQRFALSDTTRDVWKLVTIRSTGLGDPSGTQSTIEVGIAFMSDGTYLSDTYVTNGPNDYGTGQHQKIAKYSTGSDETSATLGPSIYLSRRLSNSEILQCAMYPWPILDKYWRYVNYAISPVSGIDFGPRQWDFTINTSTSTVDSPTPLVYPVTRKIFFSTAPAGGANPPAAFRHYQNRRVG
jgi:hypothetical protein